MGALTAKERASLRAAANGIEPVLQVGKNGVCGSVIAQADEALAARGLIKGSVLETCALSARQVCDEICAAAGAEPVQVIGRRFVIYREIPDKKADGI